MLKETQYLRQIERLEEQIKDEAKERKERHDRLIEALREKQKALLDSRNDEISDLKSKVSDLTDAKDRKSVV